MKTEIRAGAPYVRTSNAETVSDSEVTFLAIRERLGAAADLPITFMYAGSRDATMWQRWGGPLYGFAALLARPAFRLEKGRGAFVLTNLRGHMPPRKLWRKLASGEQELNALAVYGIALDIDGTMSRAAIIEALRQRSDLTISYNTYSDGQNGEDRTRVVVIFSRPITGDLLHRLITCGGFGALCFAIEERLGLHGCDPMCMEAARCNFLPAYPPGVEPWFEIFGSVPIDAVVIAEQLVPDREAKRAEQRARREALDASRAPVSLIDISRALNVIPAHEYRVWFQVLAALHFETGGGSDGLDLAHAWSATAHNYDEYVVERLWVRFDPDHANPYTAGTIYLLAKQYDPRFVIGGGFRVAAPARVRPPPA